MVKWSEEAWDAAADIFERIKRHPFIQQLAAGTLSESRFRHYISQDRLYLEDYTRVLAHIASRLPEMDDVSTFLSFASDGVAVEKSLHEMFSPDMKAVKTDACEFYTSYLRARSQYDVAVEAAAVLPCFWIYLEVGKYILSIAELSGNPYKAWIETYSDATFELNTAKAVEICDRLASGTTQRIREKMTQTFMDCARMEWLFWDSAYSIQ